MRGPVEAQPLVGGQAVGQVVAGGALAQGEGDGHRVLLDGLVGLLAPDAARAPPPCSTLVVARNGR